MSTLAPSPLWFSPSASPALVLFGYDLLRRPAAAWYSAQDLIAAERVSSASGYAAVRISTVDEQALALRLPRGQLAPDGQLQVPLLSPDLFRTLQVLTLGIRLARVKPAAATGSSPPPPQPVSPALLEG